MKSRLRIASAIAACLMIVACSGGGGGNSSATNTATSTTSNASTGTTTTSTTTSTTTTTPTAPPPAANTATVIVDNGPAALRTGSNPYYAANTPYVSVTLCAPGSTTNCQTIDHVLLDTGSVGLRVFASVINSSVLSALPNEKDDGGNPVGSCYGYVDGYVFGAVRMADFTVGGETVSGMPFQAIADSGPFSSPPRSCSSGGGTFLQTVQAFAANGILGIGVTTTDCGANCTGTLTSGSAIYYDCPSSGCGAVVGRSASTSAPFQQLPNPVAAMSVDNNGTLISLPPAPASGQASLTGTVYFGIGTQSNNTLGAVKILATTGSGGSGAGLLDVSYFNVDYPYSYIDSGSNGFYFIDNTIPLCTAKNLTSYYCPTSGIPENPTIKGANGITASAPFTLNNAQALFINTWSVAPGVGGNPATISNFYNYSKSFDFGLGFFYGRNIYTAIEGRNAGGTAGPYIAY